MRRVERAPTVAASGSTALILGLALPLLSTLAACNRAPEPRAVEEIRLRGELRVVTVNSPTSYYLGTHGAEGLEFGLVRVFSKKLGVALVITPVANVAAMQAEIAAGQADIAAAQLTADEAWLKAGDAAGAVDRAQERAGPPRDGQ